MSAAHPVLRAAADDDVMSCRQWAHAFFRELYGPRCSGHLVVCSAPPGNDKDAPLATRSFPAADLAGAAAYAAEMAARGHVWFGVGTLRERPKGRKRGGSKTVATIPGVWSDVDVLHPVHSKSNLPPTPEAAMRLIAKVGLPPTVVIDTGHGLQPYWLFHQPRAFANDAERDAAQALLNDFKATVAAYAKAEGWDVDAVADLARLMRPPGTVNRKEPDDPRSVRVHLHNPDCRYTVEQIRAVIRPPEPEAASGAADRPSRSTAATDDALLDDYDLLHLARRSRSGRRFDALWDGDSSAYGNDASRGDLALCGCSRSGPARTPTGSTACSAARSGGATSGTRRIPPTGGRTGR